tara:strand:- start:1559 stop:2287 length:729 start_codon:yes stop_codon:yes gene_type:complete
MQIFVPTLGRPDHQPAYEQLKAAELDPLLVVDLFDPADYTRYSHIRVQCRGIAEKRQAILEHANGLKFMVIDDDITVRKVVQKNAGAKCKIHNASPDDIRKFMIQADKLLDFYAHGGIHPRAFVNKVPKPHCLNRTYYRQLMFFNPALFIRTPKYTGETAEDIRFMIELLEQCLDYFIITNFCMTEKEPEKEERWSEETRRADMESLAKLYPHRRLEKSGRVSLNFRQILKNAKKERQHAEG